MAAYRKERVFNLTAAMPKLKKVLLLLFFILHS